MVHDSVALVGAFPPPIHGFALINQHLQKCLVHSDRIILLSTSPRVQASLPYYWLEKLKLSSLVLYRLLRERTRIRKVIISLDGGLGFWLNLPQAYLASTLGFELFVYHHSARSFTKTTFALGALTKPKRFKEVAHIMCSQSMADFLRSQYGWQGRVLVVNNLAYVNVQKYVKSRSLRGKTITLGFLSNLLRSKGVLAAVASLRRLLNLGVDARLIVAGAFVDKDVEMELREAKLQLPDRIDLPGQITGFAKEKFFSHIDVLLFPTLHPHETQSLVVPEAFAAGVPVIAYAHNFVSEVFPLKWPGLIDPRSQFDETAAVLVSSWLANPDSYARLSTLVLHRFSALKCEADQQIATLLKEVEK